MTTPTPDRTERNNAWTTMTNYARQLFHRDTPWTVKLILAAAIFYLLSPLDLIPDWLTGLGLIDDLTIVTLLVAWAIRRLPHQANDTAP